MIHCSLQTDQQEMRAVAEKPHDTVVADSFRQLLKSRLFAEY